MINPLDDFVLTSVPISLLLQKTGYPGGEKVFYFKFFSMKLCRKENGPMVS